MKKAQGISLNVIIIAAIALIVLVVLVMIFTGRMNFFGIDGNETLEGKLVECTMSCEYGEFIVKTEYNLEKLRILEDKSECSISNVNKID